MPKYKDYKVIDVFLEDNVGNERKALLEIDGVGSIYYRGRWYASTTIALKILRKKQGVNGWKKWQFKDNKSQMHEITELRTKEKTGNGGTSYYEPTTSNCKKFGIKPRVVRLPVRWEYKLNSEVEEGESQQKTSEEKEDELTRILNAITKVSKKCGYYKDDEVIKDYHIAITKSDRHFVILSGPAGNGKTVLALLYAAASGNILTPILSKLPQDSSLKDLAGKILEHDFEKDSDGKFLLIRVRPNWTGPGDLLGRYNPIEDKFVPGKLFYFLEKANKDSHNPHFLILDEMNLSHPEHYLSDIISAMETGGPIHIKEEKMKADENITTEINYPENLYITATINIDETTKPLSHRLKSRACIIRLTAKDWQGFLQSKISEMGLSENSEVREIVDEIIKPIMNSDKEIPCALGYRDIAEIVKLVKSFIESGVNPIESIDKALKLRFIQRIRGTEDELKEAINESLKNAERLGEDSEVYKSLKHIETKLKEGYWEG